MTDTLEQQALEPDTSASSHLSDQLFTEFPLSEPIQRAIAERGYARPTLVQARVIGPALQGGDLIVRSKTGTGKTAAFGLPIIERLEPGAGHVQAIALCPTRELALQVADEIAALGRHKPIRVAAIYGGASMQKQLEDLRAGAEFVVGTPGRVLDHLRRGTLDISKVKFRVLDEADEMLSMGFFEEVSAILDGTPKDAQTLLFSATVSPDIETLIRAYAPAPETILLTGDEYSVENIENILYETREEYPKPRNLLYLLEKEDPPSAVIFCNTRDDTAMVTAVLNRHGLDADFINSDLSQKDRERAMGRIKRGELRFLVATDLAARGIDISDLSHVINYSLPEDPAVYMHRVGRTGRIGKKGKAISLITGRELGTLRTLEKKFGIEFDKRRLPDADEARKHWAERHVRELRAGMADEVFEAYLPLAHELSGRPDGEYLLAYALKFFFSRHRAEKARQAEAETGRPEREPAEEGRRERGRSRRDRDGRDGRDGRGERRERGGRRGRDDERRGREEDGERRERRRREPEAQAPAPAASPEEAAAAVDAVVGTEVGTEVEAAPATAPVETAPATAAAETAEPRRRRRRRADAPVETPAETPVEAAAATDADGATAEETAAPGAEEAAPEAPPSRDRLFVGLGSRHGLDADGVRDAVAGASDADPLSILSVEVQDERSYVQARDEDAARVLVEANGKAFQLPSGEQTELRVEFARPPRRHKGGRRPRRRRA